MEIKITSAGFKDPCDVDPIRRDASLFLEFPDYDFLDVFCGLVSVIVDEIEENPEDDLSAIVSRSVDWHLLYYADQWCVMKHYQLPHDADFYRAIDDLVSDLEMFVTRYVIKEDR